MAHIVTRTGIGKDIPSAPLLLDVGGDTNVDGAFSVLGVSTFSDRVSVQLAASSESLELRVPGESEPTFSVRGDGRIAWGPGGSVATDVSLARTAVGVVTLDGSLVATQDLTINGDSTFLGNTVLGDVTSDTVAFTARISSSFVPETNKAADIGESGLGWRDLYISGNSSFGESSSDTLSFLASVATNVLPNLNDAVDLGSSGVRWRSAYFGTELRVGGSSVFGDQKPSSTVTFDASVASDFLPETDNTHDLGSGTFRWAEVHAGTVLDSSGDTIVGSSSSNSVTFNALVASNFVPSLDQTYTLGSASNRWDAVFADNSTISGTLSVTGDAVFGDASTDTVTFNAQIDSDLIPATDNTYDIGSPSLRWASVHVGPASFIVHNDTTDTQKIRLKYEGQVGGDFFQLYQGTAGVITLSNFDLGSGVLDSTETFNLPLATSTPDLITEVDANSLAYTQINPSPSTVLEWHTFDKVGGTSTVSSMSPAFSSRLRAHIYHPNTDQLLLLHRSPAPFPIWEFFVITPGDTSTGLTPQPVIEAPGVDFLSCGFFDPVSGQVIGIDTSDALWSLQDPVNTGGSSWEITMDTGPIATLTGTAYSGDIGNVAYLENSDQIVVTSKDSGDNAVSEVWNLARTGNDITGATLDSTFTPASGPSNNSFTISTESTPSSGIRAQLIADSTSPIQVNVDSNLGMFFDVTGRIGVNHDPSAPSLSYDFDVLGTGGFSDTLNANKTSGDSLFVESIARVKGSLEADSVSGVLDIGVDASTGTLNLGTGGALQTVNVGTGVGQTVINIGAAGDIVNISGTVNNVQTIESVVSDKTFTVNAGGANGTTSGAGLLVEEAGAALLATTAVSWQSGQTVRYSMVDTGDISVGDTVTVTGFSNTENNGAFVVTSVVPGTFIDVLNPDRPDNTLDEAASGSVTNPTQPAKMILSSASDAWESYTTAHPTNFFALKNSGADTTLDSTAAGLVIDAPVGAVLPANASDALGSSGTRWDLFSDTADINTSTINTLLTVDGDTVLGDAAGDSVTFNAIPEFVNGIGSNLIPAAGVYTLGSLADPWASLFLSGTADIGGALEVAASATIDTDLTVNGNTVLGDDPADTVSVNASFATALIPDTDDTYALGSATNRWSEIFVTTLTLSGFTEGSVLFTDATGAVAEDNANYFWDNTAKRLGIGVSSPDTKLHLSDAAGGVGVKFVNTNDSVGMGFYADTTSLLQFTDSFKISVAALGSLGTSAAGTDALEIDSSAITRMLGGFSYSVGAPITANYTLTATDTVVLVDSAALAADCEVTLPDASSKRVLVIKDIGNRSSESGRNIVLKTAVGTDTIEFGAAGADYIMDTDGISLTLHSDGTGAWYII